MAQLNCVRTRSLKAWALVLALVPLTAWAVVRYDNLQVDNVNVNGNTISTTNTNGNLTLDMNGTGGVLFTDLTATTVPYLSASKVLTSSAVTPTELGYLTGVTSAVQTQLDAKVLKSTYTAKGAILAATAASTPAVVTVGTDGLFLKADSGTATGVSWASPSGASLAVSAKVTTYTATTADDILLASGSAFTITLYTAVGNTGKTLYVVKTDATLANIITIDGDGTETIGGATTLTLGKQYEAIRIVSDGTNWQILTYQNRTGLVASGNYATTVSCNWPNTGTALDTMTTDADCPNITTISNPGPGTIVASNGDKPEIAVTDLPAGTYLVEAMGTLGVSGTGIDGCLAFNDSTTTGPTSCVTGIAGQTTVRAIYTYSVAGTRTFTLWGAISSGTLSVYNDANLISWAFYVYRM